MGNDKPQWKTIGFDIEADGLLDTLTKIHMIHIIDMPTGKVMRFDNKTGKDYRQIDQAVSILQSADLLIAQNGIGYDIQAIQKFYPEFQVKEGYNTFSAKHDTKDCPEVYDTLVVSKVLYSDMFLADMRRFRQARLGKGLRGTHGLKAWGYRLGVLKGEFAEDADWSSWSQAMSDYCVQDCIVTRRLWQYFEGLKRKLPREAFELEHDVAWILQRQHKQGYFFDTHKAEALYGEVAAEYHDHRIALAKEIPPWEGEWFTPKVNNKKLGYVKGIPFQRKPMPFNPTSRKQIVDRFKQVYDWEPEKFTKKGQPCIDDEVLNELPFPEAKSLARLFFLKKLMGQLHDGENGWLKMVAADGRIHGSVNTNGAVTGRMTHSKPNLAQVPSVKKEFGKTCRECFCVPKGRKQVGIDASGLELRMLSHYLFPWDKGAYAREVLEGDIHTANQKSAELPERDDAKTFIYAFCYGAGDAKLGSIVGGGAKEGSKLRATFLRKIPAMGKLTSKIKSVVAERGSLRGLDGRTIPIRSEHAALNSLLQGAGAIVMKKALVILDYLVQEQGLKPYTKYGAEGSFEFVANVHDEWQIECEEAEAELIGELGCKAITLAGEYFDMKIRLDGEAKVGNNWADCH